MKKIFCITVCLGIAWAAAAQGDTSKVKFKPGTLVGKYYGTYDTTAKKPVEPTSRPAGSLQSTPAPVQPLQAGGAPAMPSLKTNQMHDPIEVSGTERVTAIEATPVASGALPAQSVAPAARLEATRTYDPIEVSGTERVTQIEGIRSGVTDMSVSAISNPSFVRPAAAAPATSNQEADADYRATRLGSSSPMYHTYETNAYGAGSVTTNRHKASGSGFSPSTEQPAAPAARSAEQPISPDTRMGSSSPLYNTYEKNAYGAGSVTTNQHKAGGGYTPVGEQPAARPKEESNVTQRQRLGSSSPEANTYEKNRNGAGSVTTNQNKSGGGIPAPSGAQPEQGPPTPEAQ